MKKLPRENWVQECLRAGRNQWKIFEKVDADLAELARLCGCPRCKGALHRANFERKVRGGVEETAVRFSFSCGKEGCRRRLTPPSVRFLPRRLYAGFIVVLMAALTHGVTPRCLAEIREVLGIDVRTVERWRQWWLETFARSAFWRAARARFMPGVCEATLPLSLCERFDLTGGSGMLALLRFLAPAIGPGSGILGRGT